ncbi:hypothetical protein GCM10010116_01070 [Microbispora rosea subsp. aerata]|nr:LxmA leader domain family RiPP [Microbispora rosea]GGO00684.1 hypothetical protein GCM10010116_01070 [Microbispora rosea subsp. aerata]GIH56858.1 hypothetical protein Mro02_37720 [Microbispora rosea subsp. aerata]GLJ84343.1 hypothetical protein GCM10017588_30710 [Microbispora rosea subsp. aerata]
MSIENLMDGAEAYSSLAEVANTPQSDAPEATPTVVSSAIASFNLSWLTVKGGC